MASAQPPLSIRFAAEDRALLEGVATNLGVSLSALVRTTMLDFARAYVTAVGEDQVLGAVKRAEDVRSQKASEYWQALEQHLSSQNARGPEHLAPDAVVTAVQSRGAAGEDRNGKALPNVTRNDDTQTEVRK